MSREIDNIEQLPDPEQLLRISQALALADAILMPDWEGRYFSFNSRWNQELCKRPMSTVVS